jgi:uncharacterized protein with HEPN domain
MKDRKKLRDILDAITAIEAYSVSSYDEFLADTKTQDAILYNLIIIGEAANQISEEYQEQHHNIPWSAMIGTRNIIVHGYDQVKLEIVWKILQRDLEHLKTEVAKVINA